MLRTLIIGLGRAGLGLHVPVLQHARSQAVDIFADHPIVGVDPGHTPLTRERDAREREGLLIAGSLRRARELLDPAHTVVHLCTPPAVRAEVLRDVASLGFSRILMEKPLAGDQDALQHILHLAREYQLRLSVVAPWLHSALTQRLAQVVGDGRLGAVRSVSVTQHKPRFRRSLGSSSHTSAFDVEAPHAVGVLLRLLGDARVCSATCADLQVGKVTVPCMGGARLELIHGGGVRSEIVSDLSSPVRQRRIVLDMAGGSVVGHYAIGQDDDFAQLEITRQGHTVREVLRDDSLTSYVTHAYRRFTVGVGADDLDLHIRTVQLLDEAKRLAAGERVAVTPPAAGPVTRRRSAVRVDHLSEADPRRSRHAVTEDVHTGQAAPGVRFAGIGDEAAADLAGQLHALRQLRWRAIELRNVDGVAVADLDDRSFAGVADRIAAAGLEVVCLDSRIANWGRPITGRFEDDLAELRVLARRCAALGTQYVRVMSYPNAGLDEEEWGKRALDRMTLLVRQAEQHGLVLLHENCSGWAGTRADRMLDLLDRADSPALRLLFDIGNGVPHGYDARALLSTVIEHVAHVHVKDARIGPDGHVAYTLPGDGESQVRPCLKALLDHGYTGAWSIEPHTHLRPHQDHDTTGTDSVAAFVRYGRSLERLMRQETQPARTPTASGVPHA